MDRLYIFGSASNMSGTTWAVCGHRNGWMEAKCVISEALWILNHHIDPVILHYKMSDCPLWQELHTKGILFRLSSREALIMNHLALVEPLLDCNLLVSFQPQHSKASCTENTYFFFLLATSEKHPRPLQPGLPATHVRTKVQLGTFGIMLNVTKTTTGCVRRS